MLASDPDILGVFEDAAAKKRMKAGGEGGQKVAHPARATEAGTNKQYVKDAKKVRTRSPKTAKKVIDGSMTLPEANNERRHLSLPERAAATALTLASEGRRKNGRWERNSVPEGSHNGGSHNMWRAAMKDAGAVLDHLGEARLKRVRGAAEGVPDRPQRGTAFVL